jgi:AbrB family looped-hinge helix DNA binding protein
MSTTVTIDGAGRLVLPKPVREHHGLGPGSELELDDTEGDIRLRPVVTRSPLREVHGLLVYTGRFSEETADPVRADRQARLRHVTGRS